MSKNIYSNIEASLNALGQFVDKLLQWVCLYQSISQNTHIWKLADLNEHPLLIDDAIVAWKNLHNHYCT